MQAATFQLINSPEYNFMPNVPHKTKVRSHEVPPAPNILGTCNFGLMTRVPYPCKMEDYAIPLSAQTHL